MLHQLLVGIDFDKEVRKWVKKLLDNVYTIKNAITYLKGIVI